MQNCILLLALVGIASASKCYNCYSAVKSSSDFSSVYNAFYSMAQNSKCSSSDSAVLASVPTITCDKCARVTVDDSLMLGCLKDSTICADTSGGSSKVKTTIGGKEYTVHCCSGSYCNGAIYFQPTYLMLLLPLIAALLNRK